MTLAGGHPIGLMRTILELGCDLGLFLPSPFSFPLSLNRGPKAALTLSGSLPVVASLQDGAQ